MRTLTDFFELTAADIAKGVKAKSFSAREVLQAHFDRIDAVNPSINAIVEHTREDALKGADRVDDMIAKGEDPGPLAGVPTTIKVNVDQANCTTTNGLVANKDLIAREDSPVVANLRASGAVLVGRTNTPAFSLRWFAKNDLHGQTLNPRNTDLTPGGSSGGAGAAVAAGLCAVGHGTDIAGSVRYPAYACGVHGLRPTVGRVPAYNASGPDRFIGAQMMAVSGPLARSMEDIGLSLTAMSSKSVRDPWYAPAALSGPDYPKRAALCVAPDDMPVVPEIQEPLISAAQTLAEAGWEVEEIPCPPMRLAAEINAILWMAESQFGSKALVDGQAEQDAQFVFDVMRRDTGPLDLERVMTALQTRAELVRDWELFFQDHPLLICPVSGELPFAQQRDVTSEADFMAVYEAQLTQRGLPVMGMPALSVATGSANGAPLGVQLVAGRFREDILLTAGAVIEAAGPKPSVATPL